MIEGKETVVAADSEDEEDPYSQVPSTDAKEWLKRY